MACRTPCRAQGPACAAAAVEVAQTLPLQADTGDAFVAQDHGHGVHQEMELHALLRAPRSLPWWPASRPVAAVDDVHFPGAQAPCRAGRIHGRVAAAHHHDPLAGQVGRIAPGNVAQHLHRVIDPRLVFTVNVEVAASMRAQGQHDGRIAVRFEALDGEVSAQFELAGMSPPPAGCARSRRRAPHAAAGRPGCRRSSCRLAAASVRRR